MKIQNLAIIFIIIILPIAMVVTAYIQTQIDTIALQTQYNNKLQTATADAIKAFQLNTINNKYSTLSDSKIRDIEASISTFYNSLGTELGASGYSREELQEYIPAILYTMYDGYYINSKYYNSSLRVADLEEGVESYGAYQYGLKPYIYYACRYKTPDNKYDFIVNYTLDNNITIYGIVNGEYVTKSGALINPRLIHGSEEELKDIKYLVEKGFIKTVQYPYVEASNRYTQEYATEITYDGIKIEREVLKEQLVLLDSNNNPISYDPIEYEYTVCKNSRIYKENGSEQFFRVNNKNQKEYITDPEILAFIDKVAYYGGHLHSNSSVQYFYDAYKFSKWVTENLNIISQKNAYDIDGKTPITDFAIDTKEEKIFDLTAKQNNQFINNPLLSTSTFNQNRISVIRKSIQTNLAAAIASFSSGKAYEYTMPVFNEEDWDKLVNNISVSTFMQGIPIGAKYYNNYCIITNDKNKEVVTTDSIYVLEGTGTALSGNIAEGDAHLATCREVIKDKKTIVQAYRNIDFERQTVVINEGNERYYYPHSNERSYNCMVGIAQTYNVDDLIQGKIRKEDVDLEKVILESSDIDTTLTQNIVENNLRKVYLTALTREKYDLYKTNSYFSDSKTLSKGNITIYGAKGTVDYTWQREDKSVEIPVQPGLTLQYKTNDGEWITVDPNDPNINDGKYTTPKYPNDTIVTYRYTDGTSSSEEQTITVNKIDKESPTIDTFSVIRKGSDFFIVSLATRDNASGIAEIKWYYRPQGTTNWGEPFQTTSIATVNGIASGETVITAQASKYGLSSGVYEVYAVVTDVAGNEPVRSQTLTIPLDAGAVGGVGGEAIRATVVPTKWTNQNVSVVLSKNPKYRTIYQINSIDGDWNTYTNTLTIEENRTAIYYAYYDGINMLSKGTVTINNIDKIKPDITSKLEVSSIKANQVALNIGVQDKQSGLKEVILYYRKQGDETYSTQSTIVPVPPSKRQNIKGEGDTENKTVSTTLNGLLKGKYEVYAEVYDMAGNKTSTLENGGEELVINVGDVPEATNGDATANPTYWTNQNVTVTVNEKAGYSIQYQINAVDGYWDTYYGQIIQNTNGTVYYRYTDGVNTNNYGSISINNIDKKAPTISSINTSDVTTNSFKVTVEASDGESGISQIIWKYRVEGKEEVVFPENEFVPRNGTSKGPSSAKMERTFDRLSGGIYYIVAEVYDVAGNKTESETVYLKVEGVGDITGKAEVTPNYWTNQNVNVKLPETSGLTTEYQENNVSGTWNKYVSDITVTKNETIYYRNTDGVNASNPATVNITNIDKVNPRIISDIMVTDAGTNNINLLVRVQDSDSGLGKIVWYYKTNTETTYQSKETKYSALNGKYPGTREEIDCYTEIEDLESGKEYEIYCDIYDVAGNKVKSATISSIKPVELPDIPVAMAKIEPTTWTNDFVRVSFPTLEQRENIYLEYLTPETEGEWEYLDDYEADFIEMSENGTINLRYSDGTNIGKASTININNIDKIKPIVTKDMEVSMTNAIDLTGLATGSEGSHTHIYATKHNSTQHWEQCEICGNKINIKNHTLKQTPYSWGYKTCYPSNMYTVYCEDGCGYSIEKTDQHTLDPNWINIELRHIHIRRCTTCGGWIESDRCRDKNGNLITCKNLGTCVTCGHNYTTGIHHVRVTDEKGAYCEDCNTQFVQLISKSIVYKPSETNPTSVVLTWRLKGMNGAQLNENVSWYCPVPASDKKIEYKKNAENDYTYTYTITFDPKVQNKLNVNFDSTVMLKINGQGVHFAGSFIKGQPYAADWVWYDHQAPTSISCTATPSTQTSGFSNKVTITAKVKDTISDTVQMRLLDSNGTTVLEDWKAAVESSDIFTGTFDAIVEATGTKTLYVESRDKILNVSRQSVSISKVDSKAPTYVGADGNTATWAKTKTVTFKATDAGIGDVSIGFNKESDYSKAAKVGNNYQKTYLFTGDVYTPVTGALYLKDGLGNSATIKVNITGLDNTIPTITNVTESTSGSNLKLTVTANDRNTILNKEGSGVKYYAVTTSEVIPDENSSVWQTSNVLTVPEGTQYYVWAKDAAGNISGSWKYDKSYKIPTQVETSSSNVTFLNLNITVQDKESGLSEIVWCYKKASESAYTKESRIIRQRPYSGAGLTTATTYTKQMKIATTGEKYDFYVEIYDGAGNKTSSNVKTISSFVVNDREYTISYNLNGGVLASGVTNPSKYRITSNEITLNNPSKTGNTFKGWTEKITNIDWTKAFINQNNGLIETNSSYPNSYYSGPISLRANETYTISGYNASNVRWMIYDKNANFIGKASGDTYKATSNCYVLILYIGTQASYSTDAQRSSSVIVGHTKTQTKIEKGSSGNREYVATWNVNNYTATFNSNGGNAANPATITKAYGAKLGTLPTTSKTGSSFNGWYTAQTGGNKISADTTMPVNGTTYYAHWTLNTYKVTYNANNGNTTTVPADQTKTYGVDLKLSTKTPTRSNTTPTAFTVTFDANGGTSTGATNNKLTAARTTKYTFKNWNTVAGGTGTTYNPGDTYKANGGATMYAQWTATTTTAQITLPKPTRKDYICTGWYTSKTGGTKRGDAGAKWTPNGTVTLYAQWTPDRDRVPPNKPTNLAVIDITETTIVVKATGGSDNAGGSGLAGYQYSKDGKTWSGTIANGTNYTVSGLTKDTNYTIYARSVDKDGNVSGTIQITAKTMRIDTLWQAGTLNWASNVTIKVYNSAGDGKEITNLNGLDDANDYCFYRHRLSSGGKDNLLAKIYINVSKTDLSRAKKLKFGIAWTRLNKNRSPHIYVTAGGQELLTDYPSTGQDREGKAYTIDLTKYTFTSNDIDIYFYADWPVTWYAAGDWQLIY